VHKNRVDEFLVNPRKALFTLAIPMIAGMFVQIMYNIADTAFVGRLGADAIAALTFSFPLFFILISVNSGIGIGMSSLISRLLGAKNKDEAENVAMHGLLISISMAIVISVVGILTLGHVFRGFGASETVVPLAVDFMSIILFAIVFMFVSFIINSLFAAQGDTKTPMKMQITSLVVNIILEPIFIYVLGLGVKGAALGTLVAFVVSLSIGIYFIRKKSYLRLRWSAFKFTPRIIKEIYSVGGAATLMMLLISVYTMFINRFMSHYGTEYVASFGIVVRLESVATMPVMALSMALVTLVGMFYGAKRFDLLKDIIHYSMKMGVLFTSTVGALFFLMPYPFLRIFTPDANLLSLGSAYMRLEVFTFPLMIISMLVSRAMQGMGFGLPGLILNLIRVIIVAIPAAYIFVYILGYGYMSICVAAILGGVASNIVAFIWLHIKLRKFNSRSDAAEDGIGQVVEEAEIAE
jgi:putative MATE family efflux protein